MKPPSKIVVEDVSGNALNTYPCKSDNIGDASVEADEYLNLPENENAHHAFIYDSEMNELDRIDK